MEKNLFSEKLYKCGHCDKLFRTNSILTKHKLVHTGDKPYECKHCAQCFSSIQNLKKHLRVHADKNNLKM